MRQMQVRPTRINLIAVFGAFIIGSTVAACSGHSSGVPTYRLNSVGLEGYAHYKQERAPKAFVASRKGAWSYSIYLSIPHAIADAFARCEAYSKNCRLYDVNGIPQPGLRLEEALNRVNEIRSKYNASVGERRRHVDFYRAGQDTEDRSRLWLSRLEKQFGANSHAVARQLLNVGYVVSRSGRYLETEQLADRALRIFSSIYGPKSKFSADALVLKGYMLRYRGNYEAAESTCRQALEIYESFTSVDLSDTANALNCMTRIYLGQGRAREARPLSERALAIRESLHESDSPMVAVPLTFLADVYAYLGDYSQAAKFATRAAAIFEESFGSPSVGVAFTLGDLARYERRAGNFKRSAELDHMAIEMWRELFGSSTLNETWSYDNLLRTHTETGDLDQAIDYGRKALAIQSQSLGENNWNSAQTLWALAEAEKKAGQIELALKSIRDATGFFRRRISERNTRHNVEIDHERSFAGEAFELHVEVAAELLRRLSTGSIDLVAEAFEAAQLSQATAAAKALSQMAARFAANTDRLGQLIRQRQDAANEWLETDAELVGALGRSLADRDKANEERLRKKLQEITRTLDRLDRELFSSFPEFSELSSPRPLSLADSQRLLGQGEAMLSYLVTDRDTYVWVIRPDSVELKKIDGLGDEELAAAVSRIRDSIIPSAISEPADLPIVDLPAAYALYQEVVSPIESMLSDVTDLLIVPDKSLRSLPFEVLVRRAPQGTIESLEDYRSVSWFFKDFAITTLPSVSSLRALRQFAKVSSAKNPFTGFGNPALGGTTDARRGTNPTNFFRGKLANTTAVRNLPSLPETESELLSMARALGAPTSSVYVLNAATESKLKSLDLSESRVVAFATHGLVAGELNGNAEPALVLTPPEEASLLDDGLLTASEVAQLRFDASYVILSACNTASDDGSPGAEGLSGLAKAFLYAGSRALLVSHWPVETTSARTLTTNLFELHADNPKLTRAEALRRVKLDLLNGPGYVDEQGRIVFSYAHPFFWAPFTLVGDSRALSLQSASR